MLLLRGSLLLQGCDDGGDKLLFAGNHSRQQQAFLWNLLDVVGLLEQFLRLVTAAQHDAVFFDDVGQQEEEHGGRVLGVGLIHQLLERRNQLAQSGSADRGDLSHTKADIGGREGLVVLIENFLSGAGGKVAARFKHRLCVLRDVDTGNTGKVLGSRAVHGGAGRRTEHQCVRQNGGAKQSGNLRLDFHCIFTVELIDDGGSAAQRLVAEVDRIDAFQSAQTVVVDDLEDVGALDSVDRLVLFVVVHQDKLLFLCSQEGAF